VGTFKKVSVGRLLGTVKGSGTIWDEGCCDVSSWTFFLSGEGDGKGEMGLEVTLLLLSRVGVGTVEGS
jgi:hypothetical protein